MMKKETNFQIKNDELPFGLEFSQFVYFIFAIGGSLIIAASLLFVRELDFEFFWNTISACIFWVLFYNTYKIKSWVVIPVLVYSAFGSFHGFLEFLSFHPANKAELAKKGFLIIMCSFFLFQLIIFSRKKTKDYFKEKGTTVIS